MKHLILLSLTVFFASTTLIIGCKPDPDVSPAPGLTFTVPKGWPEPIYKFQNNELTDAGFALGRKLFFDPRLSRNNTVSCGSCHQPFAAFAQLDHDVSHGVEDRLGTRNSPSLFNLNWHKGFFWDGGVNHIESQPINPIQNPLEMDESLDNIIAKLKADSDYKTRFRDAFGNDTINSQRIFKAISQFMGMLVSSNAKYDKYTRGEPGGEMSALELKGLTVFRSNCASCHSEPLFSDFSYRNNGLPPSSVNDSGRAHITLSGADLYKFKVPSLRNLKYTGPYMHDGRIKTLDKVLDYYATGIHHSPTLDPALTSGITLSSDDRAALIAFLNTLNDEEFVRDKRFQEVK
jgi:cytochrome c peroxidase